MDLNGLKDFTCNYSCSKLYVFQCGKSASGFEVGAIDAKWKAKDSSERNLIKLNRVFRILAHMMTNCRMKNVQFSSFCLLLVSIFKTKQASAHRVFASRKYTLSPNYIDFCVQCVLDLPVLHMYIYSK